jgi:hypothetical protein
MSLKDRTDDAMYQWINSGKKWDFIVYRFWDLLDLILMPTPALGFVLGGIATTGLIGLAAPMIPHRPIFFVVLTAAEIGVLAWIWQLVYDRYWRNR